jgi:hypothetical protein
MKPQQYANQADFYRLENGDSFVYRGIPGVVKHVDEVLYSFETKCHENYSMHVTTVHGTGYIKGCDSDIDTLRFVAPKTPPTRKESTVKTTPGKVSKNISSKVSQPATNDSPVSVPVCKAAGKSRTDYRGTKTLRDGTIVKWFHTSVVPVDTRYVHTFGIDSGSSRIIQRIVHNQDQRIIDQRKDYAIVLQFGVVKLDGDIIKVWREIREYHNGTMDCEAWTTTPNYVPRIPRNVYGIGMDYASLADDSKDESSPITESWSKAEIAEMVKHHSKRANISKADRREFVPDPDRHDPYTSLIAHDANESARREARAHGVIAQVKSDEPIVEPAPIAKTRKVSKRKAKSATKRSMGAAFKPAKETKPAKRKVSKAKTKPVQAKGKANKHTARKTQAVSKVKISKPHKATIQPIAANDSYIDCMRAAGWID